MGYQKQPPEAKGGFSLGLTLLALPVLLPQQRQLQKLAVAVPVVLPDNHSEAGRCSFNHK